MAGSTQQQDLANECMEHPRAHSIAGTGGGANAAGLDNWLAPLVRTIECEVIPRLMLAHTATRVAAPAAADAAQPIDASRIEEFAWFAIDGDMPNALRYVDDIRRQGVPIETIYLNLFAPVARRLGDLWNDDACDFTQVTVGLWHLQRLLHELSGAFRGESGWRQHERRILIAATPGEQHTFGLTMVMEFFRRAGWEVIGETSAGADDLTEMVRKDWFGLVGISLGSEKRIETLTRLIRAIKLRSRNRAIGVMVGGPIFVQHPELVAQVGADATAVDGRHAVAQAQSLLSMLALRG